MIHIQQKPRGLQGMGAFSIAPILPGRSIAGHDDHGYGPFARFDLSGLEPGGVIPMHEHSNDEIVTYMTSGTLRHSDSAGSSFDVDAGKIMVMNAGFGFRHEERVPADGIKAEWLQIPRSLADGGCWPGTSIRMPRPWSATRSASTTPLLRVGGWLCPHTPAAMPTCTP